MTPVIGNYPDGPYRQGDRTVNPDVVGSNPASGALALAGCRGLKDHVTITRVKKVHEAITHFRSTRGMTHLSDSRRGTVERVNMGS